MRATLIRTSALQMIMLALAISPGLANPTQLTFSGGDGSPAWSPDS